MRPSILIHGPATKLSSFTLVNRRLRAGLRARGWQVTLFASDDLLSRRAAAPLPDVYLFFGHPYDLVNAPGRVNAFFLSYDYPRFGPADPDLARRLNTLFDLVLAPSTFAVDACRRSGVTRPVVLCPLGVDSSEFHPGSGRQASGRAASRPFEFLALGGAYERKGTDVLARAFNQAFRQSDHVRLVIKAFSYEHELPWVHRMLARAGTRRRDAPVMVMEHAEARSVAPYYRRADAGVYPFRGEGFGLTILECLACGTPVLATRGCAPLDYARIGVDWITAAPRRVRGREYLEPDVDALASLMRAAYRRGRPSRAERARIADGVREWTWHRTLDTLDHELKSVLARASTPQRGRPRRPTPATRSPGRAHVTFATYLKGSTSWRLVARRVEEALARRAGRLSSHGWYDPASRGDADIVVGQSGFCLEAFRASLDRRPDARRIVYRESGPIDVVTDIADEERRRCGVPALGISAMSVLRLRTEHRLADMTVVLSAVSRDFFVAAGHPADQIRIVRPGIDSQPRRASRGRGPVKFVFAASDPFRKGVRVLFDAWRKAGLSNAQLVCVTTREISLSRSLVATLVSDPSIEFVPYLPQRAFLNLYDTTDCVVLPTFEDGFPFGVADALARGIPAIVSDRSGIHEVLTHAEDAWIVPAGSTDALAHALTEAAESRQRLKRMGGTAYETARRFDWRRFDEDFCRLVFA